MESNNISTSQIRRVCKMNNNSNEHTSKSNTACLLQDQNFTPFDNTDPDAFINVLEEDAVYHIIDDDDGHE